MRSVRIPYFRIWYSSAFIILFLFTSFTTLVTPADLIYQSIRNNDNIPNIISIAGTYTLTITVFIFTWASRIYTNRGVLNAIPKSYIPVDAGEVPRKVHRTIVRQWERSALVAWDSRPRDVREELLRGEEDSNGRRERHRHEHTAFRRRARSQDKTIIPPEKALTAWGPISHPGWSSPASDDLPNLEYYRIFVELPHLIEAKAVSLAPPDSDYIRMGTIDANESTIPDARIVAVLQRPSAMTLRDYLSRLSSFNLINPPHIGEDFLNRYEFARFSTSALTEPNFRQLMSSFASILTGMTHLDIANLEFQLRANYDEPASSSTSTTSSLPSFTSHTSQATTSTTPYIINQIANPTPQNQTNRLSVFSNLSSGGGGAGGATQSRPSSRFTHVRSSSTGTVRTALSRGAKTMYYTPSISLESVKPEEKQVLDASSSSPSPSASTSSVIRNHREQESEESPHANERTPTN